MNFFEKKEKENPSIFLATTYTGTYHKNMPIWNYFSMKSGEIRPFFSMKNPLL
jgi:hypothetical protein